MDERTAPLLALVEAFRAADPTQQEHKRALLSLLRNTTAPFSRDQYDPGHVTASAFVLSPDHDCLLLIRHRKLNAWLQPGGHVEIGENDLCLTAAREAIEETGLKQLHPLRQGDLLDIDVHAIPAHRTTPAHQHFDVRFLFEAGSMDLQAQTAEVDAVRWVPRLEIERFTGDESVLRTSRRIANGR